MDMQSMSAQEIMELQKKNCIFCKILAKEIPSHEIYSDEKVSVILDINPAGEGHCLVLPKDHFQILPQIPENLIAHLFVVAKKTSRVLLKSLGVKGTTIFVANGAIAGQKAPHFMIHVMSRKHGDMLFELPKTVIDERKLTEIQVRLAAMLGHRLQKSEPEHKGPVEEKGHETPQTHHDQSKPGQDAKAEESVHGSGEAALPGETAEGSGSEETEQEDANDKTDERKDLNIDDIANLFLK
jgi:histidine triad (HIT) family protein